MLHNIFVKGAREHNLKNVDVEIPRDKLVVLTGLSGSGKSSLAFDTIYAEGQRRYMESLSSYARMFLGQMEKPDVDYIDGLSPAISIDQKTTSKNPRSTVGTVTEIYDYLRLLWARIGIPHCPKCGKVIEQQTIDQIIDKLMALPAGTRIQVMAPIVRARKGEFTKIFEDAKKSGYVRVRVDGSIYDLSETISLEKNKKHNVEIVVDRLVIKEEARSRIVDSVEIAAQLAGGIVIIDVVDGEELLFSQNYACEDCGISIEELTPRMFSFNNPFGACPDCTGLGAWMKIDPERIIPNPELSILDGAICASGWGSADQGSISRMFYDALAKKYGFSLGDPVKDIPKEALDAILYGTKGEKLDLHYDKSYGRGSYKQAFEGVIPNLERRYKETGSEGMRADIEESMSNITCPTCHGKRLKKEALAVTVGGINLAEFTEKSVNRGAELCQGAAGPAHRAGKEDRRANFKGNQGAAGLSQQRGFGIFDAGPQRGYPVRRREPAHPAGDPDRLLPDGGALHSRRALHRPAPEGQRQASRDPQAPAGFRKYPAGCGARRGYHVRGGLHRRRGPRRGRARRGDRVYGDGRGDQGLPGVGHRAVSVRQEEHSGTQDPAQGQRAGAQDQGRS